MIPLLNRNHMGGPKSTEKFGLGGSRSPLMYVYIVRGMTLSLTKRPNGANGVSMSFFFTAPTTTIANPNMRDYVRARRDMAVEVEGVKVMPTRQEAFSMLKTGTPVAVREEAVAAAKVRAEADALKQERFIHFCKEDGIVNGRRLNPERGVIEVFAPDAMGYPSHVLDECPETGEYR